MADQLPTTRYYQLNGANQKSSKYEMPATEPLALYNLDFDTPGAWQKRPGSTLAIASGLSGAVQSLFEYQQLLSPPFGVAASDFIMAADGLAIYYNTPLGATNATSFTLLSSGWTNGQPPDMLTFVNNLWIANGQKFVWWNGATPLPAGLPSPPKTSTLSYFNDASVGSPTWMAVGGATAYLTLGNVSTSLTAVGVYAAYSYIRTDGYQGPANFLLNARNLVGHRNHSANGAEFFDTTFVSPYLDGFTSAPGVTAVNIWLAADRVTSNSATFPISPGGLGSTQPASITWVGNLGFYAANLNVPMMSQTLMPNADLTRFHLFTTIPTANLFLSTDVFGNTSWATTFIPGGSFFDGFAGVATSDAFSAMTFDFFSTYTPKYLEVDQNIMFMAGFSAAPSVLWYSEVGAPETVLPESSFEVRTNDGDRVYGMQTFNSQLIVMKENSFHRLIGSSSDNFQLIEVTAEYGCISNKTIVQRKQAMYWLDKKGILEFNGASFDIISTPVEGIFKRMNIPAAKDKACGIHYKSRNQLWFAIPIDNSTQNNITIVYDYLVGGWTFFDGFNPASFGLIRGALNNQTLWRGDYTGLIHYSGESFFSDSGKAISCVALTRFENVGGENQTTLWRRFFLDVGTATGVTVPINCQFFSNYDQNTIQATFMLYQNQFQTRAEFGVQGKSVAAQFSHCSASLPLLINGYAFANRGLRNV